MLLHLQFYFILFFSSSTLIPKPESLLPRLGENESLGKSGLTIKGLTELYYKVLHCK